MKVVKKGRYILHAPWHSHNGKEVEVIMKRKGISPAYEGKTIFHLAFDPDDECRSEDYDDEFVAENFRELEPQSCILDTSMATQELMDKFKPFYKILQKGMKDRMNIEFIEQSAGESAGGDFLAVFYLVDDGNGLPGLTVDRNDGEIISITNFSVENTEVMGDINVKDENKPKTKRKKNGN
jgi:hypothetical protein